MKKEKLCVYCGKPFVVEGKASHQKYCSKSCNQKRWQQSNKDYGLKKMRAFRKNNPGYLGPKRQAMADKVALIKEETPCKDCGNHFPACCMEFDHVDTNKHGEVGLMVSRGRSWEDVTAEMAKCDIVCSNCHRIRTRNGGSKAWTRKTLEKDEQPKSLSGL